MPRHTVRLVLLMLAFAGVGYAAMKFFTAESFYEFGHYRGDSVAEIASDKPKYKGTAYCASCHSERVVEWSKGVHNGADRGKIVGCETCHGPAGGRDSRAMFVHSPTGADHPNNLTMLVPADTTKLCTRCHERMAGRPAQQPQIVVADHAGTQQCTICHNAHSPRLGLVAAASASVTGDAEVGKIKAAACSGCHGADGVSANLPGPSLAGQNASYFIEAFNAYGSGARDNAMMSAVVKAANTEDAANLAAYFASLKCESRLARGNQASVSQATAAKCIGCHGANGVSTNRSWPNLVGFSKTYLADALRAYRDGARKNVMMAGVTNEMGDAHIEAVAAYYADASCR